MIRMLLRTNRFVRAAKRIVKKNPAIAADLKTTLELLAADAFDPRLRTHKLSGELANSWACSASYDLRVIFSFVQHEAKEAVVLESVGNHDEVY